MLAQLLTRGGDHEAAFHRRIDHIAAGVDWLFGRLGCVQPDLETDQRVTCRFCYR